MCAASASSQTTLRRKNRRLVVILCLGVVGMFGFGYALVPLYNVFCNALGINGKTKNVAVAMSDHVDKTRTITVQFLTNLHGNLHWSFYPKIKSVEVHPGENKRVAFYAKNDTGHDMTVRAVPSISPGDAARHFKKTECFCFTYQTLEAHRGRTMPLLFHLDTNLPQYITTVTLAYTLFDETKRYKKH